MIFTILSECCVPLPFFLFVTCGNHQSSSNSFSHSLNEIMTEHQYEIIIIVIFMMIDVVWYDDDVKSIIIYSFFLSFKIIVCSC